MKCVVYVILQQAYTSELELEVAHLLEENAQLKKKHEQVINYSVFFVYLVLRFLPISIRKFPILKVKCTWKDLCPFGTLLSCMVGPLPCFGHYMFSGLLTFRNNHFIYMDKDL